MRFYSYLLFPVFAITVMMAACSNDRKKEAESQQKAGPRPPAKVDGYIVQTKY